MKHNIIDCFIISKEEFIMKVKKNKVSFSDIQTFNKSDKFDAVKKDPNSDYNSFFNSNPNKPDPSSQNIHTKD